MKPQSALPLFFLSLSLMAQASSTEVVAPAALGDGSTPYQELVDQLGAESFSERELATETIWKLGERVLPYLKIARGSADPELAHRASTLIQNIESGILPTTDEGVLKAISEYSNSTAYHVKLDALEELAKLDARKQALYLLRNEDDGELRLKLAQDRRVRKMALQAAHAEAADGRIDEAISILRLAPYEGFNLRALAHLLEVNGQLDQELKMLEGQKMDARNQIWKLTLLQSKGDLALLKKFAEEQRLQPVLSVLAMMDGNPHLVLNELIQRSKDAVHTDALRALKKTFQKNTTQPAIDFTKSLANAEDESVLLYHSALSMLVGQRDTGERLLELASPPLASEFYKSMESSAHELRMLGCPDPELNALEFEQWLAEQIAFELDLDRNHLNQEVESKIKSLGVFYYQRGKRDLAKSIYTKYLAAVWKQDQSEWVEVLADMTEFGMAEMMLEFVKESSLEGEALVDFNSRVFGGTSDVELLWSKLSEREIPEQEQFAELCALMALPKSSARGLELERELLESAMDLEAEDKIDLIEALAYAAEQRGDYVSMLNYYKQLTHLSPDSGHYLKKYRETAELQMHWEEILASYELNPSYYERNPIHLTRYAVAHRKLGHEEVYTELMRRAHTLSLGLMKTLNTMAMVLHECGYQQEASEMWVNNLPFFTASDWEFYTTLNYINNVSYQLIVQEKWKQASAFSIVESAIYMEPSAHPLGNPAHPLRLGFAANFTYGMALLEGGKREDAVEFLTYAHNSLTGDGVLANHFFPSVLSVDLADERAQWFRASWEKLEKEVQLYPGAHNTHNTIAWLGSRAVSRLEDSKRHSEIALKIQPNQPAYLDTLAEVHFAMGDRKSAVRISNKALDATIAKGAEYRRRSNLNAQLNAVSMMFWDLTHQHARFELSPLPMDRVKN